VCGYARIRACTKHHALTNRTRLDLRAEFIAQHSATFRSPPQHSAALCRSTAESWVLLRSAAESRGVLRVRADTTCPRISTALHTAPQCIVNGPLIINPIVGCHYFLPGYLPSFRSSPPLTGYNYLCCSTNRHTCVIGQATSISLVQRSTYWATMRHSGICMHISCGTL